MPSCSHSGHQRRSLAVQFVMMAGIILLPALARSQSLDAFNPAPDGMIFVAAPQGEGKVLVAGDLTYLGSCFFGCIGRVNADGSPDLYFQAPQTDWRVNALALQSDGKIVIGGVFASVAGQPRDSIARLQADGSLDTTFNPGAGAPNCLVVQADGKILVGGGFTNLAGAACNYLGRLNPDGSRDLLFNPGVSGGLVNSVLVLPDGRILIGGDFKSIGGQTRPGIGRLNSDGSLDTTFDGGCVRYTHTLAAQRDGKILVSGFFTESSGIQGNLARLNVDGSLDTSFNTTVGGLVLSFAVQADGRILLGGTFVSALDQTWSYIVRLNADGTLDRSFDPGPSESSGQALSLALQADGKILVGGNFSLLAGQSRPCLGRFINKDAATESLTCDGSTISWSRGGTAPEVGRTTFEATTNGTDWLNLGEGSRISGGWRLANVSLPANATIRARGYTGGGYLNGSTWFLETGLGPPVFTLQPLGLTNAPSTAVTFKAACTGTSPLTYQWFKNGVPLNDTGNAFGTHTGILTLSNVFGADAGAYCVCVSNSAGCVTSPIATLTVVDPFISSQPASQTISIGQTATLAATVIGTEPLTYTWFKDGNVLPNATTNSLSIKNAQLTNAGLYWLVASNAFGTATSSVAAVTINLATLETGFEPGANNLVYTTALQADGKILVGGAFGILGGGTCAGIGRLNADGSLDTSFNATANNPVYSLAVQADGRILVGGSFTSMNGVYRSHLARLLPDGTLDTTFNPLVYDTVWCLVVQEDGRILAGGELINVGERDTRAYVGRFNPDGSLDSSFNPEANARVYSLVPQADGKILVGGAFTSLADQPRNCLGRLNPDGTIDDTFNPGADATVSCLVLQADGRILAAGSFTTLAGQKRDHIGRLNPDGSLDPDFHPGIDQSIAALACQADGRIVVGGMFSAIDGVPRTWIGRLNADGSVDMTFDARATNGMVKTLAVQPDGRIVVGGSFSSLGGQPRTRIGRLNSTGPATEDWVLWGTTLTWLRAGTAPELWRTSFDSSTDGTNWVSLGAGIRTAGGWQVTSPLLSTSCLVRARGVITGGNSCWFVESTFRPFRLVSSSSLGWQDPSGCFAFYVASPTNQEVVIEGSADLVHWTALKTNISGPALFYFSDPGKPSLSRRFYRARAQQ